MELIKGNFVNFVDMESKIRSDTTKIFQAAGIKYINDSSVCLDTEGKIISVIDFAVEDYSFISDKMHIY